MYDYDEWLSTCPWIDHYGFLGFRPSRTSYMSSKDLVTHSINPGAFLAGG